MHKNSKKSKKKQPFLKPKYTILEEAHTMKKNNKKKTGVLLINSIQKKNTIIFKCKKLFYCRLKILENSIAVYLAAYLNVNNKLFYFIHHLNVNNSIL